MRRVRALVGLVLAAACDCGPQVQQVSPALDMGDDPIEFGLVAIGDSPVRNVRIASGSNTDLTLKISVESADGAFRIEGTPKELLAGNESFELSISFTPTAVQVYDGTLVVETNDTDPVRGKKRIILAGEGKSPQISVTPEAIGLSAVACPPSARSPRCTETREVTIENIGLVNLTLGNVELKGKAGGALPPNLRLGQVVSATTLGQGETLRVPIVWKPAPAQAQGDGGSDFDAVLTVPSNDPAHPLVEVPVKAHADPNKPPSACIQVLEVTRREYVLGTDGRPKVVTRSVPNDGPDGWQVNCAIDDCTDGDVRVKPGMTVKLTSKRLDPGDELANPCTSDPEGESISYAWVIGKQPPESRARMSDAATPAGSFEVDAVGAYEVTLTTKDGLLLAGSATRKINAIPRDDIFVQLSWQGGIEPEKADLDLHLLADTGPNLSGAADLFCTQDTFFFNPVMKLFDDTKPTVWPRFLRDDQGTAGQLESATLVEAPPGSTYRVAVHAFAMGSTSALPQKPKLTLRLKGKLFGPFEPVAAGDVLATADDVWEGAAITFPVNGDPPTAVARDVRRKVAPFVAVGACP